MRLERDGTCDWFLLNAPKRSHKGLAVNATITCQHICAQLSKKNLYLSFDDGNGVGTAQFLLEQILRNTGWRLDFCETFYEQDGETEKVRSIKSEGKRGAYLLISDVCKLFGARPVFDGDSRSVRVCSLNRYEDLLELSFGKNLTAIDRKEDAENIVTRLYVEGEYSDSGYVGIDEVNLTGLPFLLDFSYFRELGVFTDAHQAALDAYLRDVRTAKADSSETAAQLIEMDGQLNSLWGQTDYVLYVLEGGAAKRIIPGGGATDAQKEIGDEDVVTVLLSDGTHREQTGPTFEADAQYAVKWIQRASGVIGGREVAIEAKRSSIQSLYRQYEKETDETKRQSLLDQIAALEDGIAQLYAGTDADEGLYALMRRAVLLAIDRDDLRQVYEVSLSGQEAIENRFAEAMGDMLIDGYWSNTSYAPGQEELLYREACEVMEHLAKPTVSYTASIQNLSGVSGYEQERFTLDAALRIRDEALSLNDMAYITKLVEHPEEPEKDAVTISNDLTQIGGVSLDSVISRITGIAELINQKKALYDRSRAITDQGSIPAQRLEGMIDV
ncbi:MAG: hypothetical protein ACI4MK_07600 [Aristaeellaceae bacterium]